LAALDTTNELNAQRFMLFHKSATKKAAAPAAAGCLSFSPHKCFTAGRRMRTSEAVRDTWEPEKS